MSTHLTKSGDLFLEQLARLLIKQASSIKYAEKANTAIPVPEAKHKPQLVFHWKGGENYVARITIDANNSAGNFSLL